MVSEWVGYEEGEYNLIKFLSIFMMWDNVNLRSIEWGKVCIAQINHEQILIRRFLILCNPSTAHDGKQVNNESICWHNSILFVIKHKAWDHFVTPCSNYSFQAASNIAQNKHKGKPPCDVLVHLLLCRTLFVPFIVIILYAYIISSELVKIENN